jgi:hypothetical protein
VRLNEGRDALAMIHLYGPQESGGSISAAQQLIGPLLLQVEVATPASATNHKNYCSDCRNNESDGKTSDDSPLPFTTAAVIGRIVTSK